LIRKIALVCFSLLLFSLGALLLSFNGCGGVSAAGPRSGKIQHIVIIVQENRTPDNLFHGLPNADIANSGVNSKGQTIPLQPLSLVTDWDIVHSHASFEQMYDNGKMDGADKEALLTKCSENPAACPPANPQFHYVNPSDVAPYLQMAEQYTFGDRMFQTNEGPSFPAHQFIISGTSAPTATSNLFMAENALPDNQTGCVAPPTEFVYLIDPSGKESSKMYPCTEHPAITDELDKRGLSWKYYTPSASFLWTAPNAIEHMCGPNAAPPNATACVGPEWVNHVVLYDPQNPAPILTDISSNQLPAVSWVIPSGQNSDHALDNEGTGPSWVASIVNAIGTSPNWDHTAILITWDDWGGWYDHVPPPKVIEDGTSWGSGYVYGFRVPLIVVSPYARAAYVSHVNHDFGSLLNFIEQTFRLPSLGYADARADDLSDCFNFDQRPLQFQTIAAPVSAEHFLNDHRTPTDPDND
jgi:phospholipase C